MINGAKSTSYRSINGATHAAPNKRTRIETVVINIIFFLFIYAPLFYMDSCLSSCPKIHCPDYFLSYAVCTTSISSFCFIVSKDCKYLFQSLSLLGSWFPAMNKDFCSNTNAEYKVA